MAQHRRVSGHLQAQWWLISSPLYVGDRVVIDLTTSAWIEWSVTSHTATNLRAVSSMKVSAFAIIIIEYHSKGTLLVMSQHLGWSWELNKPLPTLPRIYFSTRKGQRIWSRSIQWPTRDPCRPHHGNRANIEWHPQIPMPTKACIHDLDGS